MSEKRFYADDIMNSVLNHREIASRVLQQLVPRIRMTVEFTYSKAAK